MQDHAKAFGLFQYFYSSVNLIRMVQNGRSDPSDVRKIMADALALAQKTFPDDAAGLQAAHHNYELALQQGIALRDGHS